MGHVVFIVLAVLFQQVFQAGQVTDGGVEPDVKIFARRIGNFNAEVRGIPADVPVAQLGLAAFIVTKPFTHLVGNFWLQAAILGPLFQESGAARVGQLEEKMFAGAQFGPGASQRRVGFNQLGGGVDRAAHFAVVAILVLGMAFGAFTFDESVWQEHAFLWVVKLLDGAAFDQPSGLQILVDCL